MRRISLNLPQKLDHELTETLEATNRRNITAFITDAITFYISKTKAEMPERFQKDEDLY